jgi:hypothetical protein
VELTELSDDELSSVVMRNRVPELGAQAPKVAEVVICVDCHF